MLRSALVPRASWPSSAPAARLGEIESSSAIATGSAVWARRIAASARASRDVCRISDRRSAMGCGLLVKSAACVAGRGRALAAEVFQVTYTRSARRVNRKARPARESAAAERPRSRESEGLVLTRRARRCYPWSASQPPCDRTGQPALDHRREVQTWLVFDRRRWHAGSRVWRRPPPSLSRLP